VFLDSKLEDNGFCTIPCKFTTTVSQHQHYTVILMQDIPVVFSIHSII
jgi:hypothetical protein